MEAGITVFREFKSYFDHTQRSPGGTDGADFSITVDGSGKQKSYDTKFDNANSLSKEEGDLVRSFLSDQGEKSLSDHLMKIFKATPNSEIENKLFGTGSTSTPAPQQPAVDAPPAPDFNAQAAAEGASDPIPF